MNFEHLPTPLARAAMRVMPAPLLQRMMNILMDGMRQSHPGLFRNLARLDATSLCIEPSDVPHRFALQFGHGAASLTLAGPQNRRYDACIRGKLDALLALLEGRVDGDMLFFSRDLEITGDTSAIVALRNTLDREEINLLDDITSLCGPFAKPARKAMLLVQKVGERIEKRMVELYEERHPQKANAEDAGQECDRLRAEVAALKTRLAKFEVRRKRAETVAS